MRALKLTAIVMVAVLITAAPVMAQNASSQQYDVNSAPSLADGVRDVSDTAGRGADAVDDALDEPESSDKAGGSPDDETLGLTVLPETGGAPLVVLGAFLVGAGLLARRIIG